ncbi:MAG: 4-(cytidine 5'-diphospho)-2-C-methyl-D-erythritol kinase [Syntrophales bacterium]
MTSKKAPAKINLCLRVVRKRSDGYHDIISLMQLISLYDELTFVQRASGIMVKCPGSILPEDENNLVYRAAAGFYDRSGLKPGIEITLQKHIPVGAGLGGGSSDAATTLVTLNELHNLPLSTEELLRLGESLGADVPFFIFGKNAWAAGKGERLTEAPSLPLIWFVLINPGFPVSTKEVYQSLNLGLTKKIIKYSIPCFSSAKEVASGLVNDLERVTFTLHPALAEIKAFLLKNGALGAAMTGSGPTMFGVFTDEESAQRVKRISAAQNGWLTFCARSLQGNL